MVTQNTPESSLVYIGTYTDVLPHAAGGAAGVYIYSLNLATGELTYVDTVGGLRNPAYVTLDPQQKYVYVANEISEFEGKPGGAVSAFQVSGDGKLTLLNHQPSHGSGPCHVSVTPSGQYMLVANYNSGSIAVYPLQADGSLGAASSTVQHEGSSVNADRQEAAHAHCIMADATSQHVLVTDLGMDKVMVYTLGAGGELQPNVPPFVEVQPGAGPRHFVFHPNGKYVFVISELDSTVITFGYDASSGTLTPLETHSTLPAGYGGESYCAAIRITPDGRYLYGSNRGHDSLAIFAVDDTTGRLTPLGQQPTQGSFPRDFNIDPTGQYVVAANQNSNTIVTFRIDAETGQLSPTGQVLEIPSPACVAFKL